jgi:ketosteroid isomerase-like protein
MITENNRKEYGMSAEDNKKVSARYLDYDPSRMDEILTPGFIGRHARNKHTWDLESHKKFWTDLTAKVTIHSQTAEGDFVATRFTTALTYNGKQLDLEGMNLMRFENGKIAELWEYADQKKQGD